MTHNSVTLTFLYHVNNARMHAYDLLGLYLEQKLSTLVYGHVWNLSSNQYVVDSNAY